MPIPTIWLNDDIKILVMSLARMMLRSVSHICLARVEPKPLSCALIHIPTMAPPVLPAP